MAGFSINYVNTPLGNVENYSNYPGGSFIFLQTKRGNI